MPTTSRRPAPHNPQSLNRATPACSGAASGYVRARASAPREYGGEALAISPAIVGKHPKKILDVHKHSLRRDAAQRRVELRPAAQRRYDDRSEERRVGAEW